MPSNLTKSFAEKSNKSEAEVDKLFKKAETIVKDKYPKVEAKSDAFYKLVVGTLKNMLGINEESPAITLTDVPKHYTMRDLDNVSKRKKLKSESVLVRLDAYLD